MRHKVWYLGVDATRRRAQERMALQQLHGFDINVMRIELQDTGRSRAAVQVRLSTWFHPRSYESVDEIGYFVFAARKCDPEIHKTTTSDQSRKDTRSHCFVGSNQGDVHKTPTGDTAHTVHTQTEKQQTCLEITRTRAGCISNAKS